MRRNVLLVASLVSMVLLTGCSWFKKDKTPKTSEVYPTDDYGTTPGNYPSGKQTTYTDPATDTGGYYPAATGGARTHTVGKKETLHSIARQYYNGDQSKWKAIYAANRAEIGENPNQIRVGQKLVIP
ncbi:MAG: LysM peptidoglycan-binding domain-containing protein [Planctomycetota bacterium]